MESLLGLIAFAAVPAYPVLQIIALRTLTGGWWYAAAVPLLAMVPIVVFTAFAFNQQSNLWPLLLILASPVALLYLLAALWLQRTMSA
jgi:hypothetical protein